MPFDGVALAAMAKELNGILLGGRVDKVQQPERDEIVITVRSRFESYKLLLCASPKSARAGITRRSKPVPKSAPMFCMLLRRRLTSGRVMAIRTHGMDRILEIDISALDELGLESHYTLRLECMGRHSNLILCARDGKIIDAIKRVDETKSRAREVLPTLRYEYPPGQQKLNAAACPQEELAKALEGAQGSPARRLAGVAEGFSLPTAQYFVRQAACGEDWAALAAWVKQTLNGGISPAVVMEEGVPADFLVYAPPGCHTVPSLSEAVEMALDAKEGRMRMEEKSAAMIQSLTTALARAERKAQKQEQELKSAGSLEDYRLRAELLTANLHALARGQKEAVVLNYYDAKGAMLTIPLDERLTPQQNAQAYYKKYNKAKQTLQKLRGHYDATVEEAQYLQTQLYHIESCPGEAELEEIRGELLTQGYLKQARRGAQKQLTPSKPLHYRSSDGFDIYVGRNNTQNDALTLRFARAADIWLHVKNTPGSHVIVRTDNKPLPPRTIEEAAHIAAHYSRARASSSVAVDYTEKRNVKKPQGARPGYVIYLTNQTIYVTPGTRALPALIEGGK